MQCLPPLEHFCTPSELQSAQMRGIWTLCYLCLAITALRRGQCLAVHLPSIVLSLSDRQVVKGIPRRSSRHFSAHFVYLQYLNRTTTLFTADADDGDMALLESAVLVHCHDSRRQPCPPKC